MMKIMLKLIEKLKAHKNSQDSTKYAGTTCNVDEKGYVIMKNSDEAAERLRTFINEARSQKTARNH